MTSRLVERIKYSPLSRLAALPMRLRVGLLPLARQAGRLLRWMLRSREWANFSYDYSPLGLRAIVCVLAELTGRSPADLHGFAQELKSDTVFAERYRQRVAETRLRWTSNPQLRYGRCLVNYMLVRASGARVIFEAGTERGLSTWAMCRALQRNRRDDIGGGNSGPQRIYTVDLQADRGGFLDGDEGGLVQRLVGDSVATLRGITEPIDLFLHDTLNEPAHTRAQLAALAPRLVPGSLLHSCWFSAELADFCEQQGMRALEYAEQVHDHWYPGARAALAVMPGVDAGSSSVPASKA